MYYIHNYYVHSPTNLFYCSRFVSLGIAFGCDNPFWPRSSSNIMFTHLIYMISNKSLEILCKRACLLWSCLCGETKSSRHLNIQISNAFPSLLFDSPLCCSFSFPPFYLSYLYFFRQYINFHHFFNCSKPSSQFISALLALLFVAASAVPIFYSFAYSIPLSPYN